MLLRRRAPLALATALFAACAVVGVVACSSDDAPVTPPPVGPTDAGPDVHAPDTGTDAPPDAPPDAPVDAPIDCGAQLLLPALITVQGPGGSTLACDATFALPGDADAGSPGLGATLCGGSTPVADCPAPDAGPPGCTYALLGLVDTSPSDVVVSQPGYATTTATGVHGGKGGCANVPPADVVVTLAAEDGGTDASADAASDH